MTRISDKYNAQLEPFRGQLEVTEVIVVNAQYSQPPRAYQGDVRWRTFNLKKCFLIVIKPRIRPRVFPLLDLRQSINQSINPWQESARSSRTSSSPSEVSWRAFQKTPRFILFDSKLIQN